jgi:phytoene/squalene synthetase
MDTNNEKYLKIFNSIDFPHIKDHPNILIAASFWEEERYQAAKVCYQFMRTIDDMIDNYKAAHKTIEAGEKKEFEAKVGSWLKRIAGTAENHPFPKELPGTIARFRLPLWTMQAFAKAMIYDINHDGFPTLASFLDYAEGASVAPASIFVHLNSLSGKDGSFGVPAYDVKEAARPCAVFSYLVHIIRDFQKDQLNNLNYFADDRIASHGLTRRKLREFAEGKHADSNFRGLIGEYYRLADEYRIQTVDIIRKISPLLEPRYQLSLGIIFSLYLMVFERIDIENGSFTAEELNPTPEETKARVYQTIMNFHPALRLGNPEEDHN